MAFAAENYDMGSGICNYDVHNRRTHRILKDKPAGNRLSADSVDTILLAASKIQLIIFHNHGFASEYVSASA